MQWSETHTYALANASAALSFSSDALISCEQALGRKEIDAIYLVHNKLQLYKRRGMTCTTIIHSLLRIITATACNGMVFHEVLST